MSLPIKDPSMAAYLVAMAATVTNMTGYRIVEGTSMGPLGVRIDHTHKLIQMHAGLPPACYCLALSRACARIVYGPGAVPEFREQLRLIQGGG